MTGIEEQIEKVAADTSFSGVVRIDEPGGAVLERAYGLADRPHGIANTSSTRFGVASGAKGFTALTVMSLVFDGALSLQTTARSVLGADLPLIRDEVTVEHLLANRSGIGDYFDESAHHDIADYLMPIPVHRLAETEDYLEVLDGFETAFEPGAHFAYCNGGFVVLALIAERVGGRPFRDLVNERVCAPAGLEATGYLRSDELPADAAVGYLHADGVRSNVLHLPVRGSGDGGIYTSASDIRRLWSAMFDGRILPADRVAQMVTPISDVPNDERRYGLGFWLQAPADVPMLVGHDAGASFWTAHDPASGATATVISNTSEGAWDVVEVLYDHLPASRSSGSGGS